MTAKGESLGLGRYADSRVRVGAVSSLLKYPRRRHPTDVRCLIVPAWVPVMYQNASAASSMTGVAPDWMRARCVAVIGNWRFM